MTYELIQGDCLDVMRSMPDNSVDSVVTDPPYDLVGNSRNGSRQPGDMNTPYGRSGPSKKRGFMGKEWDGTGIAFTVDLWHEALRVLKPGGHLLAFGGTRTYHRMAVAIEDAGFEIRDSLMWIYGSGFPKSHDVSKAIDKMAGAEREAVGVYTDPDGITRTQRSKGIWDSSGIQSRSQTAPATPEAEQWQGFGTALKPAHEPIVMARKPFTGTVAANVLQWGTGAVNVDGCRVPGDEDGSRNRPPSRLGSNTTYAQDDWTKTAIVERQDTTGKGRWPANVILDEWDEPVRHLRYNLPSDISRVIREFYSGYSRVPSMRNQGSDVPKPQGSNEVLQSGLLRQVVESEQLRQESPHVWQEASSGFNSENGTAASRSRPGESTMEGRSSSESRVRNVSSFDTLRGGATEVPADGKSKQSTSDPGTSASNGAGIGASITPDRSCASHQWDQARQPTIESHIAQQAGSQGGTSSDLSRVAGTQGAERTSEDGTLYVLECDIPHGWLRYFDLTGTAVRSPDSAARELDAQSGVRPGCKSPSTAKVASIYRPEQGDYQPQGPIYPDTGGASRFFYCAKASRSERNAGLEGMPEQYLATMGDGIGNREHNPEQPKAWSQNHHPTVKPIRLMEWLVRLVTPPGGTVLDPFMGSGSTGVAALNEGFSFIGIEREAEYIEIAQRRIEHAATQTRQLEMSADD